MGVIAVRIFHWINELWVYLILDIIALSISNERRDGIGAPYEVPT
jgi:hypothetical protein